VTANTVSRTGIAPITFDNLIQIGLYTSELGAVATVNIQSTVADLGVALLTSGDHATINAPGIQGYVWISHAGNPGLAVSVTVDDSGDSMPHTATFAADPTYRYALTGLAAQPIYLNLGAGSSTQVLGGSGGNTFKVQDLLPGTTLAIDGGSGTNTLQGPDRDTTWQITGSNAGSFTGGVSFTSMQNLVGGAGADTFQFADGAGVNGVINGGGGTNALDYSAYASSNVVVDLQTAFATGVGGSIANIENVTGASGGGLGFYNILVGDGGNYLKGGTGRRNLLIAGASASTLVAGNDDDILIGGTTVYDQEADMHSLIALMTYWSSTTDDFFATRVPNLLSGNGVPLLDPTTVTDNGGGNTLLGHTLSNTNHVLFYGSDPSQENTDYNPATDWWVPV
jgi:hypothetical protein